MEIRFWGVIGQQRNSKYAAVTSIYSALIPFFFITVATLYSMIVYINGGDHLVKEGDGGEDYDKKIVHHTPIILLFCAWLARMVALYPVIYFRGRGLDHTEISVPVNVNYIIHRSGEWTMLMLGM